MAQSIGWLKVAVLVGLTVAAVGCSRIAESHRLAAQPHYQVRLAGAQVPTDFVASWAGRCRTHNLSLELVHPVSKSQFGFKALRQGRADLACTSRRIAWYEVDEYLADRGGRPRGLRVASKAFALYVHPSNPLKSLTVRQIKQILRQELTEWSRLGLAESGQISLYGPPRASQGGQLMMILSKRFLREPAWRELEDSQAVLSAVASDPAAMGFAPVGMDEPVRALSVRSYEDREPIEATAESVLRDEYVLGQVIYLWSTDPPSDGARSLTDWLFSPAGADAIRASGYSPIERSRARVALPSSPPTEADE